MNMEKNKKNINNISVTEEINIKKTLFAIFLGYILIVISFYFLCGKELHYRNSRGNIELKEVNAITTELAEGRVVEQIFVPKIQYLEEISVQIGTFQRQNIGTVNIDILDVETSNVIGSNQYNMADLTDGQLLSVKFEESLTNYYEKPLMIRVYSLDAKEGSTITPLMNTTINNGNFALKINGQDIEGQLSFEAKGRDNIWTGLNYWNIVSVIGVLILAYFVVVYYKYKNNKKNVLLYFIVAVKKYRFLIKQLVSRDFRTKYKRSVLGMLWSFLNPLLSMMVQYFVFSNLFKNEIPNYVLYLIIGVVMFNFFGEAVGMALMSIVGSTALITKVYVPKYIYPLSRVLSSLVNFAISLIPLLCVVFFTNTPITPQYVLIIFPVIFLFIFCLGLGMLLSSLMVFFRDTQFLWGVISLMWMYATPIFYPESIVPDEFRFLIEYNPLYYFLKMMRICIIDGVSPEPFMYFQSAIISLCMLAFGSIVFKKTQDKFVLYI